MDRSISILYVEDENEMRRNTARMLERLSSELYLGCDGLQGLNLFRQYRPDIVVTDIRMPEMDGITMARKIRETVPDQPIIFITAYSESDYFLNAIEMQVDGYILKPIDYALLENKIRTIRENLWIKRELRFHQTLVNEIIKLQDDLLIVLDERGRILYSNQGFLDFFGVDCVQEFEKAYKDVASLFDRCEGCFRPDPDDPRPWFVQLLELNKNERLVAIREPLTMMEKIFLVSVRGVRNDVHTVVTLTEITEIEKEKSELRRKAFRDLLTGIYNRTYLNEILVNSIEQFRRYGTPFGLIFFDIDHFKRVNDTYGHHVGDELLKELAALVARHIRSCDIFARWGGEEFVIILPGNHIKNAAFVAENLLRLIDGYRFLKNLPETEGKGIHITCSFGVAEIREGEDDEALMERVDRLLYEAKHRGRNRVVVQSSASG
ncbi:MAG: diguanylate cyclase [Epsilonproteobacteria bacterium]|nr:diguanylate cyclase [Campylobacterota bacterium]